MPVPNIPMRPRSRWPSRFNLHFIIYGNSSITQATGRRKTAVARINLVEGSGTVTVNNQPIDNYFVTSTQRSQALQPLLVTENNKRVRRERAH